MFKKLTDKFKSQARGGRGPFDPATLNDPLALETDWSPLNRGGGPNFCTRMLVSVSPLRSEFRATPEARSFYLLFLLVGLGTSSFAAYSILEKQVFLKPEVLVSGGLGLVFTLVGGLAYHFGTRPIVFDKQHNGFWKGNIPEDELEYAATNNLLMPFKEIHAIQLLSSPGEGWSYELNLISREGGRTNVVDHGIQDKIRKDARTLAEFLQVPVWDGI